MFCMRYFAVLCTKSDFSTWIIVFVCRDDSNYVCVCLATLNDYLKYELYVLVFYLSQSDNNNK